MASAMKSTIDSLELPKPLLVGGLIFTLLIAYTIRTVFFHPLSKYNGPWKFAVSDIPYAILQLRGSNHFALKAAHDRYGPIVRVGPNSLSFIDSTAWDDIYGFRRGRAALPKDPQFYNEMLLDKKTITMATDDAAIPIRRAINPAFSRKALLEQEPLMRRHAQKLLSQLQKYNAKNGFVDMQKWFTLSMFDINSDFAFAEDLGCVENGKYHDWVQFVIDYFYAAVLLHQCYKFWPLSSLLSYLIPASINRKRIAHNEASIQRAQKRMKMDTDRRDFMFHFMQSANKENLTDDVVEAQATVVILAGSETTAVALTATLYYILKYPEVYKAICNELRNTFASAESVNLVDATSKLPYLDAVVMESMRIRPPLANGFTRVIPGDRDSHVISGKVFPPNTVVTINHYCSNTSSQNFRNPNAFIPERWLKNSEYDADKRDTVQPFSFGPRNCPGKSFALYNINFILAHLLMTFDMELGEGTQNWADGQKVFNGWVQPPLPVVLSAK